MTEHDTARSAWGRSRFGGGSGALIGVSITLGALLACGAGALFAWIGAAERPGLTFALLAAGTLPVWAALAWALLVDRATITGATRRPEESVESDWYTRAAAGVFQDLLLVGGLGAAAFSLGSIHAPVGAVLAAVVALAMLDFGARYLTQKRRASR